MAWGVKVQRCAAGDGQQWVDVGKFPSVAAAASAMGLKNPQVTRLANGNGTKSMRGKWKVSYLDKSPTKPTAKKPAAKKPAARKPAARKPAGAAKITPGAAPKPSSAKPAAPKKLAKRKVSPQKTIPNKKGKKEESIVKKEEPIEILDVPENASKFLDFLQEQTTGGKFYYAPSSEADICNQWREKFINPPIRAGLWGDDCPYEYDTSRRRGRSGKRPDFQFETKKANLEFKYREQKGAKKEHLLAQVCDYLAHGDEKALDVWTWVPKNVNGISFRKDTDMQDWIDEMAGRAQRENYLNGKGKTWPRLWLVDFS